MRIDPWLRFSLVFGGLALLSEILYYGVVLGSRGLQLYLEALAWVSTGIARAFDPEAMTHGAQVGSGFFVVDIAPECDAIQLGAMLAAAIVAFPVGRSSRLLGLAVCLPLLQLVNFARIVSLYYIGGKHPRHFDAAHEVWWPALLIGFTVSVWIGWARIATRRGGDGSRPPA
jgi:exosortase/archaeosortase family protein